MNPARATITSTRIKAAQPRPKVITATATTAMAVPVTAAPGDNSNGDNGGNNGNGNGGGSDLPMEVSLPALPICPQQAIWLPWGGSGTRAWQREWRGDSLQEVQSIAHRRN